jgi:flagellar basal-body rod protein FlgF
MDRLVDTALTAMRAALSRQSTIANNLANANTVGFRAEIANANTVWIEGQTFKTRAQAGEQVLGRGHEGRLHHRDRQSRSMSR